VESLEKLAETDKSLTTKTKVRSEQSKVREPSPAIIEEHFVTCSCDCSRPSSPLRRLSKTARLRSSTIGAMSPTSPSTIAHISIKKRNNAYKYMYRKENLYSCLHHGPRLIWCPSEHGDTAKPAAAWFVFKAEAKLHRRDRF